ncbi:MAG: aspartate carbamoyltransferase catalytic subunit [Nitrospirae bacterium]|nr:MAG: aspartate carbamoyltransferase catalytic subunit [Nitrospirota bacterium]
MAESVETPQAAAVPFGHDDLLDTDTLSAEEIRFLLDQAESFAEVNERAVKKVPTLRGTTIMDCFFEPSTRTRSSFELAGKRLSADVINFSASGSSLKKGESLRDTALTLAAMGTDLIVVRHPAAGAAAYLARELPIPVINAGDGCHAHPTQALLDLFTLRRACGRLSGLTVAIVGDVAHSRVARSNLWAMRTLGIETRVCAPPTLLPLEVERYGCRVFHDLDAAVEGVDAIMVLRIQRERQGGRAFPSLREYARRYCVTPRHVARAAPGCVVLHPGPINRGVEIADELADGDPSLILQQVAAGVAVRMAVLYVLWSRATSAA